MMRVVSRGLTPHCRCLAAFIAALGAGIGAAGAENLVKNPGFEALANGAPVHWNLFVMPQAGSEGAVEGPGASGDRAALLHNAAAYEQEPANNWSQNIAVEADGGRLTVSGRIRTEDAGEAALWVQCWHSAPWRLLGQVSSSSAMPMRGTQPWTDVAFHVDPPAGTDLVILRCVLLGRGTAWFDDLGLAQLDEDEAEAAAVKEDQEAAGASSADPPVLAVEAEVAAPTDPGDVPGLLEAIRRDQAALTREVRELRREVQALQQQLLHVQMGRRGGRYGGLYDAPTPPAPPLPPLREWTEP